MSNRTPSAPICSLPSAGARLETRGMFWLVAAFLLCPCHLPLTLGLAGLLLAGTTAGALLQSHPLAAGVLVTTVWAAGTWRGFHLLRAARRFANAATRRTP
jgi:MerE protein